MDRETMAMNGKRLFGSMENDIYEVGETVTVKQGVYKGKRGKIESTNGHGLYTIEFNDGSRGQASQTEVF